MHGYTYVQYQAFIIIHKHTHKIITGGILAYAMSYHALCDADFCDFDNTTVRVTFLPDEDNPINEHMVPITIVDDDIDEVIEQIFVVTLKHKESIREESVNLETRNSSLCRIIDNEGTIMCVCMCVYVCVCVCVCVYVVGAVWCSC